MVITNFISGFKQFVLLLKNVKLKTFLKMTSDFL